MIINTFGDYVETDYEGFYINEQGEVLNRKTGKILTPYLDERGCYRVSLRTGDGTHKNPQVHHLLANAFIPKPINATGVIFIDGNKSNYELSNLKWRVPKEKIPRENKTKQMRTEKPKRINKRRNNAHGVILYCGKKEIHFDSVLDAANYLECLPSSIYKVLSGSGWTVCGWHAHWDYEECPVFIKGAIK